MQSDILQRPRVAMEVGERDRQNVAFPSYGHDLVVFDQSRRHPLDHGPVDRQMLEVRERDVQLFREGLEELLFQSLSEQLNIPFTNLKHLTIDRAVIQRVPARLVEHYKVMPIRWERDVLTIALSNLHRYTWALEDIGLHLGCEVQAVLASRDQVNEAIRKYYGVGADTIERILAQKQGAEEPAVGLEEKT